MITGRPKPDSLGVESSPLFDDLKVYLCRGSGLMETYSRYKKRWKGYRETGFDLNSRIGTDSCAMTGERLAPGSENGLNQGYVRTLHERSLTYAIESKVRCGESAGHAIRETPPRLEVHCEGNPIAFPEDNAKADNIAVTHKQMLEISRMPAILRWLPTLCILPRIQQ